jgi:catechol 2,3-dioxygenase-like lactoylglutathione lyase family enzyme
MIRHLAGIAEIVEDVPQALAFYRDVLGFEVIQQMENDYAMLSVPGVLHFGVWNRAHAAESTLGSRDRADEITLGFTIEFEVDDVNEATEKVETGGGKLFHGRREEPWGQISGRFASPGGGAIIGVAETPWGRKLAQNVVTEKPPE